jgi:hypothetical protein
MRQLFYFMISFHVKSKVQPIVIRNSVLISVGIVDPVSASEFIEPDRIRDGSAGAVRKIQSNTISAGDFIITHQAHIVWFVVVSGKISAGIHTILIKSAIEPDEGARISVA